MKKVNNINEKEKKTFFTATWEFNIKNNLLNRNTVYSLINKIYRYEYVTYVPFISWRWMNVIYLREFLM